MQLRKEAWKKKIQDLNGAWTRDLAITVRRSTNRHGLDASCPGCSNDESLSSGKILGNLMALSAGFWTDIYPVKRKVIHLSHNYALYFNSQYRYTVYMWHGYLDACNRFSTTNSDFQLRFSISNFDFRKQTSIFQNILPFSNSHFRKQTPLFKLPFFKANFDFPIQYFESKLRFSTKQTPIFQVKLKCPFKLPYI